MPSPETTAIVRNDLGTIAWEYSLEASQRGFVGLRIFPTFETLKKSGEYPLITVESFLKSQPTRRAPRAAYNRSDYTFKKQTFNCEEDGFEELLDDSERTLFGDAQIEAETIATLRAVDVVLRRQEQRIITKALDTGSIDNAAAAVLWSTAASATPRIDVLAAKENMRKNYGVKPNIMVISDASKNDLLLTAEITDALKYTNPVELGGEAAQLKILASYFGVDEVIIADAQVDSAKKGQDKSLADVWTNTICGLYKVSSSRDLKEPSFGRSMLWTGDSPQNMVTEQYRAETNRSDVFRARQNTDEVYTFVGAGRLITGVA
jgi:hypothetical protein